MKPATTLPLMVLMILTLLGCTPATPLTPSPEPIPTPLTITVNGDQIELVPGVNVLPEIYEAARNPELLEHSDWIFVDGYWDLMPRGVEIRLEVEEPQLEAGDQPLFPGFPENWRSISLPSHCLTFDYPAEWQIAAMENGVLVSSQDGVSEIRVECLPNPVAASLPIWLAEFGPALPGEVLAQFEESINGQPAVRWQVLGPASEDYPAAETTYLWVASGDRVVQWAAWPGDRPETYDLVIHMVSTMR